MAAKLNLFTRLATSLPSRHLSLPCVRYDRPDVRVIRAASGGMCVPCNRARETSPWTQFGSAVAFSRRLVSQGSAQRNNERIACDLRAIDRGIPSCQIASHLQVPPT